MRQSSYCPICRLTVAPAAPDKLQYDETVAHEGCVRKNGFNGAVRAFEGFLEDHGSDEASAEFRRRMHTVRKPRELALAIAAVLRGLLDKAVNGRSGKRAAIIECAAQMSAKLFCEVEPQIVVRKRVPAPAPAASKSTRV